MFSFASKNKPQSTPGHQRAHSTAYLDDLYKHPYDGCADLKAPNPTFSNQPSKRPRRSHVRSLTSAQATTDPRTSCLVQEYKPSVQHESGLQSSVFSPSTDIDFELSPPSSPSLSPTRDNWSFPSSADSGSSSPTKTEDKVGRIADWFQGESAPISIGIRQSPTKEDSDPMENLTSLRPGMFQRKPSKPAPAPPKSSNASSGVFNFFSSKPSPLPSPLPADCSDEFLNLDVKRALQPQGSIDPLSPAYSPAAFKNLLQNAEGLLTRMQSAYKQRLQAVQEATAEMSAQTEELEEASTRAFHLKQQLQDLSSQSAEQDTVIMGLVEQLATERQARREEAEAHARASAEAEAHARATIRLVGEKVEQRRRRRPRTSIASTSTVSDSGFESNDESSLDDALARDQHCASPRESVQGRQRWQGAGTGSPNARHTWMGEATAGLPPARYECENCHGRQVNASWALVGDLKTENARLKQSQGCVGTEVDEALAIVEDAMMGLALRR